MPVTPNSYQSFFDSAMAAYKPSMDTAVENQKAALADQGLLSSTAGQGSLGDTRAKYIAAARQNAMDNALRQNEFGVNSALRAFELLASQALAKKQLGIADSAIRWPNDPTFFGDISQMRYLPPQPSSGPTGDPRETWQRHTESLGPTLADRSLAAQQADNAAARRLEERRLSLSERAYNDTKKDSDPWAVMSGMALNNATTDTNPDMPGFQAAAFPSQLLNAWKSTYQIDVLDKARNGDERATAIIKLIYPNSWRERLGLVSGQAADSPSSWFKPIVDTAPRPSGNLNATTAALTALGGVSGQPALGAAAAASDAFKNFLGTIGTAR